MNNHKYFQKTIENHVLSVTYKRPTTFMELLEKSFNCDPVLLKDTLSELTDADMIYEVDEQGPAVRYQSRKKAGSQSEHELYFSVGYSEPCQNVSLAHSEMMQLQDMVTKILDSLPEPTPVYSQWWFSQKSYQKLVKLLLSLTEGRSPIAFVACPTLGCLFSHFSCQPMTIFDIDEVILTKLMNHCCSKSATLVCYDISDRPDTQFKDKFQLVFVDPPWSRTSLRTFLLRTSTLLSPGGTLAISLPPVFTRPTIKEERQNLLVLASKLGLSVRSTLPGFTEYSVPSFEQVAYQGCGITLREPWRSGDLFIFTKTGESSLYVPPPITKSCRWDQYRYGARRLFLKRDGCSEDGVPSIRAIHGFEDLIYRTTSTRTTSWTSASLVSTRNCIAHAHGRKDLSAILGNVFKENGQDITTDFATGMSPEIRELVSIMLKIPNPQKRAAEKCLNPQTEKISQQS